MLCLSMAVLSSHLEYESNESFSRDMRKWNIRSSLT